LCIDDFRRFTIDETRILLWGRIIDSAFFGRMRWAAVTDSHTVTGAGDRHPCRCCHSDTCAAHANCSTANFFADGAANPSATHTHPVA